MITSRFHQEGAALAVVLLLLLAIVLPAIAIMRTTLVNEQVVSGTVDRARAFQAGEAALVEAEAFAATKPAAPAAGCLAGVCARPSTGQAAWEVAGFWDNAALSRATTAAIDGVTPRYVVEFMGVSKGQTDDCTTGGDISPDANCDSEAFRYRITVRSRTPGGAEVFLQTNYLAP